MRLVIQRVQRASISTKENGLHNSIQNGFLILVGIHENDSEKDVLWLVQKTINLRIFTDENDKMNLSILDTKGEILAISQFTLYAQTAKGNRPSFIEAAKPDKAKLLYDLYCTKLSESTICKTGIFGADMQIELINDGPVTIIIDSITKN